MKSKFPIYLLVLSLALNAGVLGTLAYRYFIAPPLAQHTCPFNGSDQHLYQTLGLTAEQLEAIKPMADSFHVELRELQAAATQQRDLLLALMERTPLDIPAIKAANIELTARQAKMQNAVMGHLLGMKRILDPAQQKVFFQLMRETMLTNR
jgi:Spy/CpxP family protein refolding chaperone